MNDSVSAETIYRYVYSPQGGGPDCALSHPAQGEAGPPATKWPQRAIDPEPDFH